MQAAENIRSGQGQFKELRNYKDTKLNHRYKRHTGNTGRKWAKHNRRTGREGERGRQGPKSTGSDVNTGEEHKGRGKWTKGGSTKGEITHEDIIALMFYV